MTGQNTAAAERSAHAPAPRHAQPEIGAGMVEIAPGRWRVRGYVERDALLAGQAAPAGGIASAEITVKVRRSTTAAELLSMAALYAVENLAATPATLRAAAAMLVEHAGRIEMGGRR